MQLRAWGERKCCREFFSWEEVKVHSNTYTKKICNPMPQTEGGWCFAIPSVQNNRPEEKRVKTDWKEEEIDWFLCLLEGYISLTFWRLLSECVALRQAEKVSPKNVDCEERNLQATRGGCPPKGTMWVACNNSLHTSSLFFRDDVLRSLVTMMLMSPASANDSSWLHPGYRKLRYISNFACWLSSGELEGPCAPPLK